MVKANKMSKEKGFAGKTTSKKSSLSLTTLMSGSNTERYYVTLDVKAARMKLEANRGGGRKRRRRERDDGGGDYYYDDDFFFFIIFGGRVCGQRGKVYRFEAVRTCIW